jgi:phage-related protein
VAGGEIGTAFIRIRPNLSGFSSELKAQVGASLEEVGAQAEEVSRVNVQADEANKAANAEVAASYEAVGAAARESGVAAGIASKETIEGQEAARTSIAETGDETVAVGEKMKTSFLSIGKILGVAFGGAILGHFVKDLVNGAAQVQKSKEVIQSTFGPDASKVLVGFGDTAAASLGISASAADATSAKFGILFKNLGIGVGPASAMTVNLEKLAGSLSLIRGIPATQALQSLSQAMLGNTRSLKQLGIAVDPTTEKFAAFKLGLIQTVTQALTPAQKAQAIYALATKNLGSYLDEAKQHSGDFASVQARLSAEWSNAKDIIGTALLPAFDKLATAFSNWLGKLNASGALQRDVNTGLRDIGDAFEALKSLVDDVAGPIKTVVGLLGGFGNTAKVVLAGVVAFKAITEATKLWQAAQEVLDAVLSANPIGIVIVAVAALATAFYELYTRSQTVRNIVQEVWQAIRVYVLGALTDIEDAINNFTTMMVHGWQEWGSTIEAVFSTVWTTVKSVFLHDLELVRGVWDTFKGVFTGDWGRAWRGLKEIVKGALGAIFAVVKGWGTVILDIFEGIWKQIELAALKGVAKVLGIIASIPTSFKIFGQRVGFANPAQGALQSILGSISSIEGEAAAKKLADQIAQNTAGALKAKTTDPFLADASESVGKSIGDHVKNGVKTSLTGAGGGGASTVPGASGSLGDTFANSLFSEGVSQAIDSAMQRLATVVQEGGQKVKTALTNLRQFIVSGTESINAKIAADNQSITARLHSDNQEIAQRLAKDNQTIAGVAVKAADNLTKLGGDINTAVGKLFDALHPTGSSVSGTVSPQLQKATDQLKALIEAGGNPFEIAQKAAALRGLMTQSGTSSAASEALKKEKTTVEGHIATLVDEANRGKLKLGQFTKDLRDYLNSQGLSYKEAGKNLGKAFADGLYADVSNAIAQVKQIDLEPAATRARARRASDSGQGPTVINVVAEIAKLRKQEREDSDKRRTTEHTDIEKLRTQEHNDRAHYHTELVSKIAALNKAIESRAEAVQKAQHNVTVTLQRESLRVAQHHYEEAQKQTAALAKIAKATQKTAAIEAELASVQVGSTSGFKTSTSMNKGKTADAGRVGAGIK